MQAKNSASALHAYYNADVSVIVCPFGFHALVTAAN
jgi:hypothetical protein